MLIKEIERIAVYFFSVVFVAAILVFSFLVPSPTLFQYQVFKTVLALAVSGVAAFIPGFLSITLGAMVRTGGAVAVFGMIYWYSPAPLFESAQQERARRISTAREVILNHSDYPNESLRAAIRTLMQENESLANVDLSGAILNEIDLKGADLRNSKFIGAELARSDLSFATVANADFTNADLQFANLSYINPAKPPVWSNDVGRLLFNSPPTKFGSELQEDNKQRKAQAQRRSNKTLLNWNEPTNTVFKDALLERSDFSNANLNRAKMDGVSAESAVFVDSTLSSTSLIDASLRGADLTRSNLSRSDLSGTDLYGARLDGADLSSVNLTSVPMCGVTAKGTNFENAIFLIDNWSNFVDPSKCGFGNMGGSAPFCIDKLTRIIPPEGGVAPKLCSDGYG